MVSVLGTHDVSLGRLNSDSHIDRDEAIQNLYYSQNFLIILLFY